LDDIKIRRLGWAGHFVRLEDEKTPKKNSLNVKYHNSRPRGKPTIRWEDVSGGKHHRF
jgi:hypothetical protein